MSFNLEVVNTGVSANDGLGDPLRTAFSKSHNNDNTLSGNMLALSGSMIDMSGVISGDIDQALSTGAIHNTGQFLITGKIDPTGQSLSSTINSTGQYITNNFVSGYVQNFVFDMPESGQSVVVSGLKQGPIDYDESWDGGNNIDSLYRGRYTLTLTERHMYYHPASDLPKEDWIASGAWQLDTVNMNIFGGTSSNSDAYIFEFPVTNVGNAFEGGNHELGGGKEEQKLGRKQEENYNWETKRESIIGETKRKQHIWETKRNKHKWETERKNKKRETKRKTKKENPRGKNHW